MFCCEGKRIIGRDSSDDFVIEFAKRKHKEGMVINLDQPDKIPYFDVGNNRLVSPVEFSTEVLKHLINITKGKTNSTRFRACISVPAAYGTRQRTDILNAANKAGFGEVILFDEPSCAALGFLQNQKYGNDQTMLIYDFGGGTFDASLGRYDKASKTLKIISTKGHPFLGGADVDSLIADHVRKKIKVEFNSTKFLDACRAAKEELSSTHISNIYYNDEGDSVEVTQNEFEKWCESIVNKTIKCCIDLIEHAEKSLEFKREKLTSVLLVGGSSQIPLVFKLLKREFENKMYPNCKVSKGDMDVIAKGAAIYADFHFKATLKPPILIRPVANHSISMGTVGNKLTVCIEKDTNFDGDVIKKENNFYTIADNQKAGNFQFFEGEVFEDQKSKENVLLFSFRIEDLPKAPKGEIKFTVNLKLTLNGVYTVDLACYKSGVLIKPQTKVFLYDKNASIKSDASSKFF